MEETMLDRMVTQILVVFFLVLDRLTTEQVFQAVRTACTCPGPNVDHRTAGLKLLNEPLQPFYRPRQPIYIVRVDLR